MKATLLCFPTSHASYFRFKEHYYQPLWTLVGGGLKKLSDSRRTMASVIPPNSEWINDSVVGFNPDKNFVTLKDGSKVHYEYLVLALGLQLNFHLVKGLIEGLKSDPRICSNYSIRTVGKTFPALQAFEGGNAIFTVPATPIKCGGAPQKIMYLAEEYFNKTGKRDKANVLFNTSLGVMFVVKHYSEKLYVIAKDRGIHVNFKHSLIEVRPETGEAIFKKLDSESGETATFKYDFLHVTPPMSAPDVISKSVLSDAAGFLNVNKETLQHVKYDNIFGVGDCTNIPTSKTAAAAAGQCGVLSKNLMAKMKGSNDFKSKYNGYTSCPLVTSSSKCILAEFDFTNTPTETFPFDQSKERRSMFLLKSYGLPPMYWLMMTKGLWHGPGAFRKIFNFWRN
ncbi:sulfide:quinone oxidoreductase, mitochondrial [Octopus sinensis]|uniref:Sulfide:quinone oxidoreductase, mitochondrial n=1 Tax=Octopus sinensis TaxID=2607531 RepID=A0A7E6FEE2_9MOLL|nr:sulfide:quinone oxidoreductase, mitochondrial [Octopus sinensis]